MELQILEANALDLLNKYDPAGCRDAGELKLYAWPLMIGRTIFAWVDHYNFAAVYCCGVWKIIDREKFKPLMTIKW